jgi:DNA invertase Pin-like site-specific DNA recombinase
LHGYARVSTADQNPDAQRDALLRAGVHPDQLYLDHTSGAKSSRPAWDGLCKALRAGDVLVATSLTSLAIYAKPTFDAVAAATAAIDPTRRR